jgi:WD40 repeat protein
VEGARLSRDEKYLIGWGGNVAQVWDVETAQPNAVLTHDNIVRWGEFSRDGIRVMTWGADWKVRIWDVKTQRAVATFSHRGPLESAQWSRDEARVLSSGTGVGPVRLWDVETGLPIRTFDQPEFVLGAVWIENEKALLSWDAQGVCRVWATRLDPNVPLERRVLQVETRSASSVDGAGVVRPLKYSEWLPKWKLLIDRERNAAQRD